MTYQSFYFSIANNEVFKIVKKKLKLYALNSLCNRLK